MDNGYFKFSDKVSLAGKIVSILTVYIGRKEYVQFKKKEFDAISSVISRTFAL